MGDAVQRADRSPFHNGFASVCGPETKGEQMSFMRRCVDRGLVATCGRWCALLLALTVGLLLLGACGSGGGTADNGASPSKIAGVVVTADSAIHDMLPDDEVQRRGEDDL